MYSGKKAQHDFPKMRGGGIKGRLELFQKIITFGDAILPLATLENANIEVLHLRSWGEFLVFTKTNSLLSLNTSKHLRTCMTIKWVFRPVRISTMLHPSWMTFSYTAEIYFRICLAYFVQSPCPGKTQTRTVGFNFENVAELARREFVVLYNHFSATLGRSWYCNGRNVERNILKHLKYLTFTRNFKGMWDLHNICETMESSGRRITLRPPNGRSSRQVAWQ